MSKKIPAFETIYDSTSTMALLVNDHQSLKEAGTIYDKR